MWFFEKKEEEMKKRKRFFLGALAAIFCTYSSVALVVWALGVKPGIWLDRCALVGVFFLVGYVIFWRAGDLSRSEDRQGGE